MEGVYEWEGLILKDIIWFGFQKVLACDGKCNKAWGGNNRPRVYLVGEDEDEDDYGYLADDELGEAPTDPGTEEGGYGKDPRSMNKWCARECERSVIEDTKTHAKYALPDLSKRYYNYHWRQYLNGIPDEDILLFLKTRNDPNPRPSTTGVPEK